MTATPDPGGERIHETITFSYRWTGPTGVLTIDNAARGISNADDRMAPSATVPKTSRLTRNMTWKWAGADLLCGGTDNALVGHRTAPHKAAADVAVASINGTTP